MSTTDSYSDIRDRDLDASDDRLDGYAEELRQLRSEAEERGYDAAIAYIDAALEEVDS